MKKFRFSFLSIKYKILIIFSLFLGITVFFNIVLSSFMAFNRSRKEAKEDLFYHIQLFQEELNIMKDIIEDHAYTLTSNRNNLDDIGYIYEAPLNSYPVDEVGYKKSYFLYRLELFLKSNSLDGISVYRENKLSHYITSQNAGLITTRNDKEVLVSSKIKTGGRIISVFWKLWEKSELPAIFTERLALYSDRYSSFSFDPLTNTLMIKAVIPVMGYVLTDTESNLVKVTGLTPATSEKLAEPIKNGKLKIIGHIVLTRKIDETYLQDLQKRSGMNPFILSPDGLVRLQILFKDADDFKVPKSLFKDYRDLVRYIRIESGYYLQYLRVMKNKAGTKPVMITGFGISVDDTINNIIQAIVGLISMSLTMLVIAWLLGFYFIDMFMGPIKSLVKASEEISNGNYKVEIKIETNDEIGNLVQTFNSMTRQINYAVEALEEQNQELLRLSSMKSEFMASMSHELRTPLNSINANTETLLYGLNKKTDEITYELTTLLNRFKEIKINKKIESPELDELIAELETVTEYINEEEDIRFYILKKSEEKLKKITSANFDGTSSFAKIKRLLEDEDVKTQELYNAIKMSGKHLLGLIDMILNVSEFDQVKLSLDRAEVNIRDFVKEAINNAGEIADFLFKRPYISITYQVENDVQEIVVLDETWTKQVLDNYLFNAIKFTDQGEVKLIVALEKNMLRFSVYDSGIGIREESKDKIFTESGMPFSDFESDVIKEEGAVSLALSKRLIMMQGGDIGFESEPGKGSVFWFTLPNN